MMAEKILFLFALVAATPFAHTRSYDRTSYNDYEWPLRHGTKVPKESEDEVDASTDNVCRTEECHKIASRIIGSMNESVNPCENFYQFTCGRWAVNNPILPNQYKSSPNQMYQNLVHRRISEILEKEAEADDILPVRQARKWYHSCMNTEKLERRGMSLIESFVTEAGGWPIAMKESDWDYENYPWQAVDSYYARLTSHNVFFDVIGHPPSNGSKIGKIIITEPEMIPNRILFLRDPVYLRILKNVVDSLRKYNGLSVSESTYEKEALELLFFDEKLVELIVKNRGAGASSYKTVDEFIDWYERNSTKSPKARIHWRSAIQELFDPLGIKIDASSPIDVQNIGYIRELSTLLKKTKLRTIVNYAHWKNIGRMLRHTTESMMNLIYKLGANYVSLGLKGRPPRWQECVIDMKMKYAAAYIFAEKYYPKSTQIAAWKMMKNIKNSMKVNIDHSNWLDKNSKSLVKEKIDAMEILIGSPKWYNNATAVTNYYKGLNISTEHLDNYLSYMRFERRAKLLLYKTPGEQLSVIDPITVNAFYNRAMNTITTPPVVFQSPMFSPELPDTVNYGQTGFFVGHEIGHGFDAKGILHGKDGKTSKLSVNILKSYYQRARCFVDQFDGYFGVIPEFENLEPENEGVKLKFNDLGETRGSNTKSENIADTTSLQAVFRAYKNLKRTQSNEPKLPGLESFTNDQLFFITFGSFFCNSETVENAVRSVDEPHSPSNFRVNGAVSNTNDFAEVFGCPEESPMNPRDKCSIWEKRDSKP